MGSYLLRRLLLLPLTMFCILLVNFAIINLAPGDPTTVTDVSAESGAVKRDGQGVASGSDTRYLQFREHYGLTLPILWNSWPWITENEVEKSLYILANKRETSGAEEMSLKTYDELRVRFGDQARFIMPRLLKVINNPSTLEKERVLAVRFFIRGGTRQAVVGPSVSDADKKLNQKYAEDNLLLLNNAITDEDSPASAQKKIKALTEWYQLNAPFYHFEPDTSEKIGIFFFDTRLYRYMSRVMTLDFGTLRNDSNKTVISEVVKRFKYSLTLSIIPMVLTLVLCLIFGFIMAYTQYRWPDLTLNVIFLILYAIPVFVVAPFLIEKVALYHSFPFTDVPIPISGFTSPERVYGNLTSWQRVMDTLQHLFLPFIAVMYGGLAAQSRLSRTAVLEVLRQDYVRTAKAKGLSTWQIMTKHVSRNASITIVTSVAASLGVVLGGSLIVETLFNINGFGKFFYDAVINRDYNVIMFSALSGSFLALIGYLVADILYTVLDPRVTLD